MSNSQTMRTQQLIQTIADLRRQMDETAARYQDVSPDEIFEMSTFDRAVLKQELDAVRGRMVALAAFIDLKQQIIRDAAAEDVAQEFPELAAAAREIAAAHADRF